jgi:hypothetical protein
MTRSLKLQGVAIVQFIGSAPWLEIIKAAAPVATAAIAYRALRNWQKQERAKRESEFLDQIVDATNIYIVEMKRPIDLLHFAKIGMASHVLDWSEVDQNAKNLNGAIAYIEKNGERDGKRLAEELRAVEPSVVKIQSLLAKGQVFRFKDYSKLRNAITMLAWHHGRIASFHSIICSPTWNWENPEVRSLLEKVMEIEPDDINTDMGVQSVAVIEFARDTYERIYG